MRKPLSRRTSKSDLAKIDSHVVRPHEYEETAELTERALARAVVKKRGRPIPADPRKLISIKLPADVIERWPATGPGRQTRMAERLIKIR